MASAIAARTQRMRIGPSVQVLSLSKPLNYVGEACMLDQIGQGRFDFGVGRGGITSFLWLAARREVKPNNVTRKTSRQIKLP